MIGKELDGTERITVNYRVQEEHEMGRVKGLGAVLGATVLLVLVAACGSGESSSQPTTPAVSLVDNLRAAGVTVDPAGTASSDFFAPQGQLLTVNGERVETFAFASAEEADAAADGVSASGSSISRVDSETGMGVASSILWDKPPHFYKAGKLIALYVGCDSDVINVLKETIGPRFAGGAGVSQCPDPVPPTTMEISQALEAAEGSEVTVSGMLIPS